MSQQTYEGVGPNTPVGVAAVTLLSSRMQPMFDLEAAAASGTDMEAVHDMRVASRRTREALRIFEHLYRRQDARRTKRTVRTVTRSLGAVRDADVFCDRFTAIAADATDEAERFALAYVIGYRRAHRVRDLDDMRLALEELHLAEHRPQILRSLHAFRDGVDISEPLSWLAEDTLRARLDEFFGHLPAALEEPASVEQHEMRKSGKHLRYAIETFRSCIDPARYEEMHKTVKRFQDVIGELHDRIVFMDAVREVEKTCGTDGAGVTREGLDAIVAELDRERAEYYVKFLALVEATPEAEYRAALMGALLPGPPRPRKPEPEPQVAPDPAAADPIPLPESFSDPNRALAVAASGPLNRIAALFKRLTPPAE